MMLLFLIYEMKNYISGMGTGIFYQLNKKIEKKAEQCFLPGFLYTAEEQDRTFNQWIMEQVSALFPFMEYADGLRKYEVQYEDEDTLEKILASQANEEVYVDENGNLVGDTETVENIVPATKEASLDLSIDRLRDFEYLLSNFYIVDSGTMVYESDLRVDELLGKNMKIDIKTEGPKVLIFHTHSQEAFADSVPGDAADTIVGMGEYLAQLLNAKGISTIHDTGVYDVINGNLDRSNAYEYAEAAIRPILEANPTIEVVIDLHRDGVAEETHLVTEIDGKQTAQVMFFNGLSRTRTNGELEYLYNPYIQDNLAFSLQMKLACEELYSGFARKTYLRGYRYSLHMKPKSLLIEAGAQTNTVEEMRNAMIVLAEVLNRVLLEK
ncbi:MAG: stage II sporulation protein P [Schaedlerella sp.]|nr:stage II sporulation protein P [Schaedlerella sp.]